MCEVAQRASQILRLLIWTVPGDFAYDLLGRWFRAQQRHGLVGGVAAAGFVVNVLTNLALHRFSAGSGFVSFGPVLGLFLQNTLLACLLLGGVARMKLVKVPPLAVLSSSSAMLYTGISSMLWTCAELWGIDVHEEGFEKKMTLIKTTFKMKVWDKTFRARASRWRASRST